MPIQGLTERRRIPRLGKLRLGIKKVNSAGKEYPSAVDYFVSDNADFHAVYGEQPKAIDICFPTDTPEDWASQFYRNYSRSRGLVCKGDGNVASRLILSGDNPDKPAAHDPTGKRPTEWVEVQCAGRECPFYQAKDCRELMMLQFLLPKLPGLGIWQLDTSSINSILNINSSVDLIRRVVGKIAMLPLMLRVVPMEVSPEGHKKTVHVLQLDISVKLPELGGRLMLPEAEDEVPEELYPTPEEEAARDLDNHSEAEYESTAPLIAEAPPNGNQDAVYAILSEKYPKFMARYLELVGEAESLDIEPRKLAPDADTHAIEAAAVWLKGAIAQAKAVAK